MAELNAQVAASGDDGDWVGSTFNGTTLTIRAGKLSTNANHAFARFDNLEVNGTITNAYISVRAASNQSNTVPIRIYAELAADPAAPTTAADANGRTLTTAFVDWEPGAWTSGTYYDSPDLSAIIQELVDAYTYDGSQAIIIYVKDNGAADGENRGFRTYDHNTTASPPKLYVEYTPANDPPTIAPDTLDEESFSTLTPTIEFTGSDAEDDDLRYQIQISTSPDFLDGIQITDSFSGGGGGSFHPQPHSSATSWNDQIQVDDRMGQAFTGNGGILDKIVVSLLDSRVDTDGTAYIRVYAHQGTFGSSSEPLDAADAADTPTPDWLAISDGVVLGASFAAGDYEFDFSGANRIRLEAGVYYVFILDWVPADRNSNNTWAVSGDVLNSGTLHPGNLYNDGFSEANNGPQATWDLHFEVHEEHVLIDALSGTDAGFANTVSGGDTDPFNAGEKIGYSVQAGDALTNNTTYYWQARVIDPAGSNTWSGWTAVRSFTVVVTGGSTYDESVTLARFGAVTSTNNLIVEAAATLSRALGVSDGNDLLLDLTTALSRQAGLAAAAGLLLDSSVSLSQGLAITLASDVTKDETVSLARSLAISTGAQVEAETAVSLARALTVGITSQADFEMAVSLARVQGIAAVGTLEINTGVNLSLFLALNTSDELAGMVVGIVHLTAQGRDFDLRTPARDFDLTARER